MKNAKPRFALVGIETSHAESWARLLRRRGHSLAVFAHPETTTDSELRAFCKEHDAEAYGTLDALVAATDVAAILGRDWNRHVECARPFVAANRAVYIDKPVAGDDRDLEILSGWLGKRLVLGSSNRREPRLAALRERGVQRLTITTSQRGDFYYGVHSLEIALAIFGSDPARVRWHAKPEDSACVVEWTDGRSAVIRWAQPMVGFEIGTEADRLAFKPTDELQALLIDELLDVHNGSPPNPLEITSIRAVELFRAAERSRASPACPWVGV